MQRKVTSDCRGPSTEVKRLSTHERAAAFPGEYLGDSMGSLYWDACHVVEGKMKNVVVNHSKSGRHQEGKGKRAKACAHQATLVRSWESYQKRHEVELAGTGLSKATHDDVIARRANVVESFLKAGVSLTKINHLREQCLPYLSAIHT